MIEPPAGTPPAADPASASGLWRQPDFRALWLGDTVSQVGTQLSLVALPVLAVQALGAREAQLGLLTAAETAAFLLIGLPAGAWVDRWRKRRVMIVNDLLRAVLFASVPLAWWLGVLSLGQLFVVAALAGICTLFFDVAYQSCLPVLVPADRVLAGNARLEASRGVAQVAGPALAGGLLRLLGPATVIGVDAVSYLGSALFLTGIRPLEQPTARAGRRRLTTEIAEGLRYVLGHRLLRRIVACTSLSNLCGAATAALVPLYLLRDLGFSAPVLGLVYSASAVGGILGAVTASRVTALVGEGRAIPVTALLCAPAAVATPLAAHLPGPWRFALLVGGGVGFSALVVTYNIAQVSYRQRVTPQALSGRMNASVRFLVWGVQPLGALAGGALGARFGIAPVLWGCAAGLVVAAVPVLFSPLLRLRQLPPA